MMTMNKNTILAKENLEGHSICLCLDGNIITDDKKGIAPMLGFIASGTALKGYSAADLIVGKAAAMLFVKAGIAEVFAKTISKPACKYLEKYKIPYSYDILTDSIINRQGTDICPMEKTVTDIDDFEEGYAALTAKVALLKQEAKNGIQ